MINKKQSILIALYFASVSALLWLLFDARTPAARTIWETFDSSNMAAVFAVCFVLLIIVLSKGNSMIKLALIMVYSVLSRLFIAIVFEAPAGWDTWASLGWSRYIYGGDFDPRLAPFTLFSQRESVISLIYHAADRVNLYSTTVILARTFSVDVYWVHRLLDPLLWGIFVPILFYKISSLICKEKKVSLLSALLSSSVPVLISWGAGTTSNGVAWIFCLFTIYLSLKYLSSQRGLPLAVTAVFVTFLTHFAVGALSSTVLLFTYIYRKRLNHDNVSRRMMMAMFVLAILLLPVMLLGTRFAIGGGAAFSLDNLEQLPGYDAIFLLIFGEYYKMTFQEVFADAVVFFLGLLGFAYVFLGSEERKYKRKLVVIMFSCTVLVMIDYRIIKIFMVNIPFSPERLWVFQDLLAIPFAAIIIIKTMNLGSSLSKNVLSINFRKITIGFLFALCISSLLTLAVYTGYRHYGEAIWTTQNELEAAQYIESTTRNQTYVVICQQLARLAGWAVVGPQNPRAYYFGPYEVGKLKELYTEMVEKPSMGPIMDAKDVNNASLVFVIFTTFRPPTSDLAVEQMMDLPHSELYGIFGDDVYVFRVQPPTTRTISGVGPTVYLYNNQTYVNTTMSADVVTYDANYTLALAGSSSYSITEWPMSWSFENVEPTATAQYIDGNKWVNFTGDQDTTYTIMWKANLVYQFVGWKDDSFKEGWQVQYSLRWLPDRPPQISTDGDVLKMTGVFQEGIREGISLIKDVSNISTDDFPYILVRWRSTSTCAIVSVSYDDKVMYVLKPEATYPYAQYSDDWKVSIVKLPPGKNVTHVSLALDDYPSWTDIAGTHSVYYDFVMFSKATEPQF